MKSLLQFFLILIFIPSLTFSQFHDYSVKYGIQAHLLQPSTEFDNDSYRLSLMGRGLLRVELNHFLEAELGIGIGELNGKDVGNENWSTLVFPTDLRLVFSPLSSLSSSPYFYTGLGILKWNLSDLPSSVSPKKTDDIGWNISLPIGIGIEIKLNEETLLDISGGYTFATTDDLNYYNSPNADDGFFDLGIGLTFVMGGSLTDEDEDGLTQLFENQIGTDPLNEDTDGDRIKDGDEVNIYKTDPLNIDTDSDKINDYEEIKKYFSDPNSPDTDGDDISDHDEITKYNSNPNQKDSDDDQLADGYEVNIYSTNPANNDTDNDKLFDNDELKKYNTDPNNPDTDGDGLSDGEEVLKYKTNPLEHDSHKVKRFGDDKSFSINSTTPIVLEGITFELNKSIITRVSEKTLNKTLNALKQNPSLKVEIRGYTDNKGGKEFNQKLSEDRALAVKIWLVKKGIDALRITTKGFGEQNPISDNSTLQGRIKNRRIEIIEIK